MSDRLVSPSALLLMCSVLPCPNVNSAFATRGACAPVALKRSWLRGFGQQATRPARGPAVYPGSCTPWASSGSRERPCSVSFPLPARSLIRWSAIPILASLLWLWELCPAKIPDRQTSQRPAPKRQSTSPRLGSTTIPTGSIDINCPPRDLFFIPSYPVSPAVARRRQISQCLPHQESTYVIPAHCVTLPFSRARAQPSPPPSHLVANVRNAAPQEAMLTAPCSRYSGTPPLPSACSTAFLIRDRSTPPTG